MSTDYNFQCSYCHKPFVREGAFMKHSCKKMKRAAEIQTPDGQAAYMLYCIWMRQQKRKAPLIDVFLDSTFYTHFLQFVKFRNRVHMSDTTAFIILMISKDIPPSMWRRDEIYGMYLTYLDLHVPPLQRVHTMVNELADLSDEYKCEIHEVLQTLDPNSCISLLRKRTFTPWLLLRCKNFKSVLEKCSPEQTKILHQYIDVTYWKHRFAASPDIDQAVRHICQQLKL